MSAPDTNTEKQEKAHKAPLRIGILLPLAFVAIIAVVTFFAVTLGGQAPEGAETQVEPGVGTEEAGDATGTPIPGAAD